VCGSTPFEGGKLFRTIITGATKLQDQGSPHERTFHHGYDDPLAPGAESGYAAYLRAQGYHSDDPWNDFVISGEDSLGRVQSGWRMRNVHLPARVREAHSETAYMTDQAIQYMQRMGGEPWPRFQPAH
jgi:hypothetical protein